MMCDVMPPLTVCSVHHCTCSAVAGLAQSSTAQDECSGKITGILDFWGEK